MSARRDDDVSFESLGQRPSLQYWDDAVNVSRWLWQEQILRWSGTWQRVMTSQGSPRAWMEDAFQLWMGWIQAMGGLSAFPVEWAARRTMTVPNLVFMIDDVAESAPPQEAPTNVTAEGLIVGATDLHRAGGAERIPAGCVEVALLARGNRVQVTLVGLARGVDQAENRRVPGLYMGVAYAYERPNMRPLAVVLVHVQGPVAPASTIAAP